MSFLGLCGIFACSISGFITSHYFQKKVSTIKCMYERIYYDSEYGELKTEGSKWKGLKEKNEIIQKFRDFANNDYKFEKLLNEFKTFKLITEDIKSKFRKFNYLKSL